MVTQVTSFSRNGLSDWIVQRVTAFILAAYTIVIVGFLLINDVGYEQWSALFDQTWMQIFTLLAIIAIVGHAWIGMWTIGTDYIREHYFGNGATVIRFLYQIICILALAVYLFWSIKILWGN